MLRFPGRKHISFGDGFWCIGLQLVASQLLSALTFKIVLSIRLFSSPFCFVTFLVVLFLSTFEEGGQHLLFSQGRNMNTAARISLFLHDRLFR
jgi:hypothetical protein